MSDTLTELVARLARAQQHLAALEVRERPLALRGWRDDFFGDVIADQYTAVSNGAGSGGALVDGFHGGAYRLTAGAGAGFYHRLWLGNATDTLTTLDADYGWVMIGRMYVGSTAQIGGFMGARSSVGGVSQIRCGIDTAIGPNWYLETRSLGGAWTITDSGIAVDTNPHLHRLEAYPIAGGLRQVDYFLDGAQIASDDGATVPTNVLTAYVEAWAIAAVAKMLDLDCWDVIPKNLA